MRVKARCLFNAATKRFKFTLSAAGSYSTNATRRRKKRYLSAIDGPGDRPIAEFTSFSSLSHGGNDDRRTTTKMVSTTVSGGFDDRNARNGPNRRRQKTSTGRKFGSDRFGPQTLGHPPTCTTQVRCAGDKCGYQRTRIVTEQISSEPCAGAGGSLAGGRYSVHVAAAPVSVRRCTRYLLSHFYHRL